MQPSSSSTFVCAATGSACLSWRPSGWSRPCISVRPPPGATGASCAFPANGGLQGTMWRSPPAKPSWATIAVGVSHCGAGCTLGDIVAEFTFFGLGVRIAGMALWYEYIGNYILAVILGLFFQYFAVAPMRGLNLRGGVKAAAKADILSLSAFEVGLFGWMALMAFVFFPAPHLHPDSPVSWFLMQIGMIIGFATAWRANVWLIRKGVKEAM